MELKKFVIHLSRGADINISTLEPYELLRVFTTTAADRCHFSFVPHVFFTVQNKSPCFHNDYIQSRGPAVVGGRSPSLMCPLSVWRGGVRGSYSATSEQEHDVHDEEAVAQLPSR